MNGQFPWADRGRELLWESVLLHVNQGAVEDSELHVGAHVCSEGVEPLQDRSQILLALANIDVDELMSCQSIFDMLGQVRHTWKITGMVLLEKIFRPPNAMPDRLAMEDALDVDLSTMELALSLLEKQRERAMLMQGAPSASPRV